MIDSTILYGIFHQFFTRIFHHVYWIFQHLYGIFQHFYWNPCCNPGPGVCIHLDPAWPCGWTGQCDRPTTWTGAAILGEKTWVVSTITVPIHVHMLNVDMIRIIITYYIYVYLENIYIYIHIQYVCVWLFNSFPCLYIWGVGPVGSNPECGLSKVLTKSVCFYGLMISQGFLFVFLRLCSIVSYTSTKYYKVFNSIPLQRQFFRVPKATGVPSSFVGSHFYSLPDTICLMHRQLSGQALARRTRISNGGNGGCSAASLRLSAGKPMGPSLLLIKTLALTMKHGFCFTGMSWPQHVLMFHVSN